MKSIRTLALKEEKKYFFYATCADTQKTVKLWKTNPLDAFAPPVSFEEKFTLGTVVVLLCDTAVGAQGELFPVEIVKELIPKGSEKSVVAAGSVKIGDEFNNDIVFGLGKVFIKNGEKVQYAYFK